MGYFIAIVIISVVASLVFIINHERDELSSALKRESEIRAKLSVSQRECESLRYDLEQNRYGHAAAEHWLKQWYSIVYRDGKFTCRDIAEASFEELIEELCEKRPDEVEI